jgi:uncharacterized membrane protein
MSFWDTLKLLFRKYFMAGLLVIVPLYGTFWILKTIVLTVDDTFFQFVPTALQPKSWFGRNIPGMGLLLTIPIILSVGVLTRVYLGKQLLRAGDWLLSQIPVGNAVYKGLKQLLQTLFGQESAKYSRVVLIEFPSKGQYAIAFVTGESQEVTPEMAAEKYIRVYVPTAPNPTSGYLLMVREQDVTPTTLTVDEASKLIISGGLVSGKSHG